MAKCLYIAFVLASCFVLHSVHAVEITIEPKKINTKLPNTVEITCSVEDTKDAILNLFLLQVTKTDGEAEKAVTTLSGTSTISYGTGFDKLVKAVGIIDNADQTKTSLKVSLINPKDDIDGEFKCKALYADKTGATKNEESAASLEVDNADKDVVTDYLLKKVTELEKRVNAIDGKSPEQTKTTGDKDGDGKDKTAEGKDKVTDGKDKTTDGKDKEAEGKDKNTNDKETKKPDENGDNKNDTETGGKNETVTPNRQTAEMTAFSMSMSHASATFLTKGDTVVFDRTMTKVGEGFDASTGIFTAPTQGLYAFNVVLGVSYNLVADFDLMVKDKVAASLRAANAQYRVQSSVGTVAQLAKGDKVKVVVHSIRGKKVNGKYLPLFEMTSQAHNLFTGYLISEM